MSNRANFRFVASIFAWPVEALDIRLHCSFGWANLEERSCPKTSTPPVSASRKGKGVMDVQIKILHSFLILGFMMLRLYWLPAI